MAEIKYVIFDFNGTLTNDAIIGYKLCNHMLRFYNVPEVSFERFLATFTTPWINFYTSNGVSEDIIDLSTHQAEYQKIHTTLAKTELSLNDGVLDLLVSLKAKGINLGVLSSRNIDDLIRELELVNIYKMFDAVVGESDINQDGIRAEKQTQQIIDRLGINDSQAVLYVGDMIPDIKIAKEYNFISCAVATGWQSKERLASENPDYLFDNIGEIKKLFE